MEFFYWKGVDLTTYPWREGGVILSFDFAHQVFEKLLLPDIFDNPYLGYEIAIINGLPAVISYYLYDYETLFDIWIMTERGVIESWIRLVSFGPLPNPIRPLGFWNNSGLLLEDFEGRLMLYDHSTQQLKNLHLQLEGDLGTLEVVNYEENLVPKQL
ncbi:uncharacterized protein LOC119993262 [Tripterygium wilfordii]|nr:uncharacterized protein LOC119993262 [Tripterygium wilfordii]